VSYSAPELTTVCAEPARDLIDVFVFVSHGLDEEQPAERTFVFYCDAHGSVESGRNLAYPAVKRIDPEE
jgi:hypothetical protein